MQCDIMFLDVVRNNFLGRGDLNCVTVDYVMGAAVQRGFAKL
jgi:hypothetical protein